MNSPNENQLLKFISYFKGPILYVMELAVLLSAGLQDWVDLGVIIGILFMNALVGWYQEKWVFSVSAAFNLTALSRQAGDIVAQLKAGIAMKCTAVRDGKEIELEARDLVPGDIIVLEEGVTIPADARVSEWRSEGMQTNPSSRSWATTMTMTVLR